MAEVVFPTNEGWALPSGAGTYVLVNEPSSSCPTPCDDDCEAACHEWHYVHWKREHNPQACPTSFTFRASTVNGVAHG
jgi:hypothetical protein